MATIGMNAENYPQTWATSEYLLRNSFQILGQVVKKGGLPPNFSLSPGLRSPMIRAEGRGFLDWKVGLC